VTTVAGPRCALLAASALALAACGGGGNDGGSNNPPPPPALNITTTSLAAGTIGTAYAQTVAATGGTSPRSFTISAGNLPAGLALAANGTISGTPAGPPGNSSFTITVTDSATPSDSDSQALGILINAAPAQRNDTIENATPLGNGTHAASISPAGDPSGTFAPDEDYYAVTTTADSIVTVDINAQVNGSPVDTVIEIVNASGAQLNGCVAPAYTSPCESDDEELGVDLDSFLQVQVNGATTFYIHVVDWGSNARPDMLYDLVISGVN
jgi:hypothetical protein